MGLKKTFGRLGAILLTSAIIGVANFSNAYSHPSNIVDAYEIKNGDDTVIFLREEGLYSEETGRKTGAVEMFSEAKNIIIVAKPNGKFIIYIDLWRDDLKVDRIGVEENGKKTQYDGGMMIEEGQKKFDEYLKLIKESRAKKILD